MTKRRDIDKTKGYRIHLNTMRHSEILPTFAEAHAGTPRAASQWRPNDLDLKDRESREANSLEDLLSLMQTGDHARLRDAVIIHGTDAPVSMKQFFIHGSERLSDLYNRVGKIKGGDPISCAILFIASETNTIGEWKNKLDKNGKKIGRYFDVSIKGQGIHVDGKSVDFELSFDYMKPGHLLQFTIPKGQHILVAGMVERGHVSRSREIVQVHVDHEGAALWVKPEDLTTPPPVQKSIDVGPMPGFFTSPRD